MRLDCDNRKKLLKYYSEKEKIDLGEVEQLMKYYLCIDGELDNLEILWLNLLDYDVKKVNNGYYDDNLHVYEEILSSSDVPTRNKKNIYDYVQKN